jgi:ATP-dependent DNA ligase
MFTPSTQYPGLFDVNDDKLQQECLSMCAKPWGNRTSSFCGPQPVTPVAADLPDLRSGAWAFAEKSDGERFLCVCLRGGEADSKFVLLVSRKLRVILVPALHISSKCAQEGTVLDCELVRGGDDAPPLLLVLFDCYMLAGEEVAHLPLEQRVAAIGRWQTYHYRAHETDIIAIRTKRFCPLVPENRTLFAEIWARARSHGHLRGIPIDGVILVHSTRPPRTGTCRTQMKLKPVHTIDLLLAEDGYLYALGDDNKLVRFGSFPERSDNGGVWECELKPDGLIMPIKIRPDKHSPNTMFTINKTLQTIADNVGIDALFGQG